jgi:hypothetical protein
MLDSGNVVLVAVGLLVVLILLWLANRNRGVDE